MTKWSLCVDGKFTKAKEMYFPVFCRDHETVFSGLDKNVEVDTQRFFYWH